MIDPRWRCAPLVCSQGTIPRYAASWSGLSKRSHAPISAHNPSAESVSIPRRHRGAPARSRSGLSHTPSAPDAPPHAAMPAARADDRPPASWSPRPLPDQKSRASTRAHARRDRPNGYRQACRYLLVDVARVEARTSTRTSTPLRGGTDYLRRRRSRTSSILSIAIARCPLAREEKESSRWLPPGLPRARGCTADSASDTRSLGGWERARLGASSSGSVAASDAAIADQREVCHG